MSSNEGERLFYVSFWLTSWTPLSKIPQCKFILRTRKQDVFIFSYLYCLNFKAILIQDQDQDQDIKISWSWM